MNDFSNYLKPELAILVPVLFAIGRFLKWTKLNDRYIPLILGAVGIVLAILYLIVLENKFNLDVLLTGFVQGILYASTSVYIHQNYKQLKEK